MSKFEFTISMILGLDLVNSFGSEEKAIFSCQGQGTKRQSSFQTFNSSRLRISSPLQHCINQPPSIGSVSNCSRPSQQWGCQLTPEPSLCRHILVSPKKITSRMRCGSSRRSHSLKRELECKSRGSTRVSQQSAASMHDCGILLARGLECMRKTISSPLFCLT